jgi:hypothetical protein
MRPSFAIRAALFAFTVIGVGLATTAYADSGAIRFNVLKHHRQSFPEFQHRLERPHGISRGPRASGIW